MTRKNHNSILEFCEDLPGGYEHILKELLASLSESDLRDFSVFYNRMNNTGHKEDEITVYD